MLLPDYMIREEIVMVVRKKSSAERMKTSDDWWKGEEGFSGSLSIVDALTAPQS